MMRRTLIVLPCLVAMTAMLGACGSFTRNCQRETRVESDYVYEPAPQQDVNVTYDTEVKRSPCARTTQVQNTQVQTQTEVKRSPCQH